MTETRKEFEEWYLKEYGNDISEYFINERYLHEMVHMQYMGWQACKSINDKRIGQLLAAIAVKDSALQACSDAMEYMSEYDIPLTLAEDTDKALAIKPEDVELVECGVIDQGSMIEWNPGALTYLTFRTKLYTIKTKGGNDANFG